MVHFELFRVNDRFIIIHWIGLRTERICEYSISEMIELLIVESKVNILAWTVGVASN